MGLDAASIGVSLLARTVRLRMKSRGLKQAEDYLKILKTSTTELNDLIESVVVTETWFFRGNEPFAATARLVVNDWLPAHPARPLRVLSVPCASGEEPYSVAMTLLDAGLTPGQFEVHAVDISERALARARRGVYGKNSFRGKDLGFRNRYFKATKEGYLLAESVRNCVRFQKGNLLDEECLTQRGLYDFIFCRNLLIYFNRETQAKAVRKLEQLLAPCGLCFVGAAELPLVLSDGFVSANIPMAFACRKAAAVARNVTRDVCRVSGENPSRHSSLATRHPPSSVPAQALRSPPPSANIAPSKPSERGDERANEALLETAQRLADEGKLAEAAKICQAHLDATGPSAEAYYLLGLVQDAGSDAARAEDFYKKALYLQPNHYEALLHLALLKEKDGDAVAARVLRQRARRKLNVES